MFPKKGLCGYGLGKCSLDVLRQCCSEVTHVCLHCGAMWFLL